MREKLIELLQGTPDIGMSVEASNMIADHLIANGVTVLVRCKDCKWIENGKDYEPYCNHWKSGLYADVKDDDFCSYGERKDNDL